VRGGGRASGDGLALDVTRLAALAQALQRRLLRFAAGKMGAALDFQGTEALRMLALEGRAGQRLELAQRLRAERTPRELRLTIEAGSGAGAVVPEYSVEIPGEIEARVFGLRLRVEACFPEKQTAGAKAQADFVAGAARLKSCPDTNPVQVLAGKLATLRNWRQGDRVRLRYSSGPRKVKEVLERLRVTGSGRAVWPVLEVDGRIVWMKGVEVEPEEGIAVTAAELHEIDTIGITTGSGDGTLE
jgi:tRNA(Ile)-lysidine synthase